MRLYGCVRRWVATLTRLLRKRVSLNEKGHEGVRSRVDKRGVEDWFSVAMFGNKLDEQAANSLPSATQFAHWTG